MKTIKNIILTFAALCLLASCETAGKNKMYSWEKQRDSIPEFADITLLAGGYSPKKPDTWTEERAKAHVTYTDENGKEHWLFEAFILWAGHDHKRGGLDFAITPYNRSAVKESWEDWIDYWFNAETGQIKVIDKTVGNAKKRIGEPSFRHSVVATLPTPIMFEVFGDKKSSTTYWGEIDGRQMDFSRLEDQIAAFRWMIDRIREAWDKVAPENLDLAGFYIIDEELYCTEGSLNYEYKRWDQILRPVSDYAHSMNYGMYWIPYYMAPGYEHWKMLGFDMVYMQPNHYWDWNNDNPFESTIAAIDKYGMGMELEFEGTHGEGVTPCSSILERLTNGEKNPRAEANRKMLRDYFRYFKEAGYYGKKPLAIYTGTNGMYELSVSTEPEDVKMYNEYCRFIIGNPLRKNYGKSAGYVLSDSGAEVKIGEDGRLLVLRNAVTGHNYAGGESLWRMFYNTHEEKEMQIDDNGNIPSVTQDGNVITIAYNGLTHRGKHLDMDLILTVTLENGAVRFGSTVTNNEPGTIIRELQYPLVGDMNLPEGHALLTTHTGGQVFDDPLATIVNVNPKTLYMKPDQYFRQFDLQYPRHAASNCYAFIGEEDGLYFGSHDRSLQQTWHGLRAYPSEPGQFDRLEAGFYRYPNAMCGDSWSCDVSIVKPYMGSWTETSRIYRNWIDCWWDKQDVPQWVKEMTGWQRIIFKHQYGEYLRKYTDLPGRINDCGKSVGCNTVLAFGWWSDGMDNGYPNYYIDETQGGEEAWKKAIAEYREDGNRLVLYYNGRLIDRESDFYLHGNGKKVANKDNTGAEFAEHYKFTGEGTTLGYYDTRTFSIANMADREWRDMLIKWADRAMSYGADAVFYDQLGVAEEFPNWDISGEFPVQDIYTGRYKADALKEIRDHIKAIDPEFCLGTEWLSDCTAQFCDFVHIVEFTALPESFPEWFRYTFPEVIWSDRCVRDDTDIERRVNNTLLKGLVNDIEVFRCRGLIDETPHYQQYLAQINAIRHKYPELLPGTGTFVHTDGFTCSSEDITARGYENGDRLAIVATTLSENGAAGRIKVPGYRFVECSTIGDASVSSDGSRLRLGQHGITVLIYEK